MMSMSHLSPAVTSPLINPLNWVSPDVFKVNGHLFRSSHYGAERKDAEEMGAFWIMKNPELLALYSDWVVPLAPRNVVEVGVAGGGAAALLMEWFQPEKLCLIDLEDFTTPTFKKYLQGKSAKNIRCFLNVDQSDKNRLEHIMKAEFRDEALDLVIDDASHLYEQSLATFETLFPKLKPNGLYILEDWGWSHWQGDYWQGDQAPWRSLVGLSNLVFQCIMASASRPGWISKVVSTQAGTVIFRGPEEIPAQTPIETYYFNRGRKYLPF